MPSPITPTKSPVKSPTSRYKRNFSRWGHILNNMKNMFKTIGELFQTLFSFIKLKVDPTDTDRELHVADIRQKQNIIVDIESSLVDTINLVMSEMDKEDRLLLREIRDNLIDLVCMIKNLDEHILIRY